MTWSALARHRSALSDALFFTTPLRFHAELSRQNIVAGWDRYIFNVGRPARGQWRYEYHEFHAMRDIREKKERSLRDRAEARCADSKAVEGRRKPGWFTSNSFKSCCCFLHGNAMRIVVGCRWRCVARLRNTIADSEHVNCGNTL